MIRQCSIPSPGRSPARVSGALQSWDRYETGVEKVPVLHHFVCPAPGDTRDMGTLRVPPLFSFRRGAMKDMKAFI